MTIEIEEILRFYFRLYGFPAVILIHSDGSGAIYRADPGAFPYSRLEENEIVGFDSLTDLQNSVKKLINEG